MGLRIDRRDGEDYFKLLEDIARFIRTARIPATDAFLKRSLTKTINAFFQRRVEEQMGSAVLMICSNFLA